MTTQKTGATKKTKSKKTVNARTIKVVGETGDESAVSVWRLMSLAWGGSPVPTE